MKNGIVYSILYCIIVTADPCVDYCQNRGNCTLTFDDDGNYYKPTCYCPPDHPGEKCELRKCYFEFYFDYA